MPERARGLALFLLGVGLSLAGTCALDARLVPVAAWLAQVPLALGLALLRGSRSRQGLGADAGRLALAWGGAVVATALLVGGPLAALLAAPSLARALLASGLAGALLVLLWWQWPSWHALARLGGPARARQAAQCTLQRAAWRGLLQVALPVFCMLLGALALAWPGLLAGTPRLLATAAWVLLLPLLHAVLQSASTIAVAHGLPVVEMASGVPPVAVATAETADADTADAPTRSDPGNDPAVAATTLARELYAAARAGRVEQALQWLAEGADPHAAPEPNARDRRSLPVLAAVLPDLRLLRALIERGVDVNAMQSGMTPLLAATRDSWHGRPEAVMTLLANGADPRLADADGNTPLHHAARSSDPAVAALLRDAAADIEARNLEGVTPLGSACAVGNWRLARFLLERGARPEPADGRPALLCAAASEEDDAAGVQLLLRHKARVNATDNRGRSALHEAALAGHTGIADTLLVAGADVQARDAAGRSPLLEAARAGATAMVDILLAAGADLHARDASGANALHLACAAEVPAPELVQHLLQRGLDPQAVDAAGHSALDIARHAGHWSLLAWLDPRADPAAAVPDADERPPSLLLRERLLAGARGLPLDELLPDITRTDLDQLLCDTEVAADPARSDWLLRHGAHPDARCVGLPTPLDAALDLGAGGIPQLRSLFAAGASPAGAGGLARFLTACLAAGGEGAGAAAAPAFALELLARGADPFGPGPGGEAPLLLAVRLGWLPLLQQLLAHGADPNACDSHGNTALHLATHHGRLEALRLLVARGAAPDRRAADGQTPLGIALACGRRDLADWLNWRGWRLPQRPLLPTDVPAAAIVGDLDAVRRLLELGFPVDATDSQGCTALLRAAGGGHRGLVQHLLAQGANPGLAARSGATALSAAVSMRHLDIVERLLEAGCGLEQRLPGEVTVLMLAAALGLPELVARLLQAGADLHARDAQGLTPLHCAALYGFTARERPRLLALLDALLLAGADPQCAAANGTTPLLLLLGARAEPGTPASEDVLLGALERLLDEEVALDARDARGYGPLHLAALHGLLRVTQALLRAGADPTQRDGNGRTPHDIALLRGYMEVAAELAHPSLSTPGSGVSMARFLRE